MVLTPDDVAGLAARLTPRGAGLLLDLDGTLLDSEPVHREAYRTFFAGRGWRVGDDVIRQFSGRRAAEVFAALPGPWTGLDPAELTDEVLKVLGRSRLRPAPVPGAARLLAACTRTGLPVVVVTSATLAWAAGALELLGVAPGSVPLVTAEDCAAGKPDPEPFRRGAERLALAPAGLVAVEDSPAGIASARAAGVGHAIGITTSQLAAVLVAAGAAQTMPDLTTLVAAVELPQPRPSPRS
ncbi:HAD family hydrolase [Pengzhenrongella sicca]|uniref:HAD-IA family hydrolase n=1 Tax=Pengzhenrongella sicca TaxID=2819238 RepID=A0A8A4ZIW1_9MICO|nr:HAD-IA family hydrolase [Pengzhenrongella sicca]QTE30447.1 HAD-IA family hydrolase [Pengzhenrongella sicca]